MSGRAFYFGTYVRAGHHLWDQDWQDVRPENPHQGVEKIQWGPLPWKDIDGGLAPRGPQVEGQALVHHRDGWTALAFWNRGDDARPGSNSAFFFEGILTFDQAWAAARKRFPHVVKRFAFQVKPLSEHLGTDAAHPDQARSNPKNAGRVV